VPAGLGIVDIVLIVALASAGLLGMSAGAAVVLYRIITLKILISAGWFAHRSWRGATQRPMTAYDG
jgi:hypothetical protein